MKFDKAISIAILVVISSSWLNSGFASETQIGRYLTTSNKPKSSQVDLLSQMVQVRFPQSVQTVGDALTYLLKFSGYSLVDYSSMVSSFRNTLLMPLPLVDRNIGPVSLRSALSVLAGTAFNLAEDPVSRTVNFHLKSIYVKTYLREKNTAKVVMK
jgi:conjugative transfer region protein (TIGR03748 family)